MCFVTSDVCASVSTDGRHAYTERLRWRNGRQRPGSSSYTADPGLTWIDGYVLSMPLTSAPEDAVDLFSAC